MADAALGGDLELLAPYYTKRTATDTLMARCCGAQLDGERGSELQRIGARFGDRRWADARFPRTRWHIADNVPFHTSFEAAIEKERA